jgi:hypothetical protein
VAGLKLEQVKLPISLHGGRLVSAGHSLSLYGGSLEGSLNIAADDGRASYRGYLQNADLAPCSRIWGPAESRRDHQLFRRREQQCRKPQQLLSDMQGPGPPAGSQRQRAGHRHRSGDPKEWRGLLAPGRAPGAPTGSGNRQRWANSPPASD